MQFVLTVTDWYEYKVTNHLEKTFYGHWFIIIVCQLKKLSKKFMEKLKYLDITWDAQDM